MAQITLNSSGVASSGSLLLQTNGTTTQATIDNSGNLGLGVTPSAWSLGKALEVGAVGNALWYAGSTTDLRLNCNVYYNSGYKYGANGYATYYSMANGAHTWYNAASGTAGNAITFTQAMTLDASGRLLVGLTSSIASNGVAQIGGQADPRFIIDGSSTQGIYFTKSGADNGTFRVDGSGNYNWFVKGAGTANMTLDSSGNLLVGTTDSSVAAGVGFKIDYSATTPYVGQVINTAGNTNTYHFYNENATNNGFRFYVNVNGGVYNYSGNNSNLSDERTKTNIELAGNYLNKICAIPVKLFNYKDEVEGEQRTLGVIAQDVEAVAPELVDQNGWLGEAQEGEAPLKSIYTTDMMFALMKAIQEQQQIITQLQADVAALKGQA